METTKRILAALLFFGSITLFYACKNQAIVRSPRYFGNVSSVEETIDQKDMLPNGVIQYVGTSINGEYITLEVNGKEIAISVDLLQIEDKYNKTQDTIITVNVFESTGSDSLLTTWVKNKNQ